jgi:hypothetical protein
MTCCRPAAYGAFPGSDAPDADASRLPKGVTPLDLLRHAVRVRLAAAQGVEREDAVALIDRELAGLFAARELCRNWAESYPLDKEAPAFPANQFLRAWGDSTGRVIQLLKARHDLGGAADAERGLLDAVYAEIERVLAEEAAEEVPDVAES